MSDMETPVYFSETATAIGGDKATMDNFAVSQGAEHYHDVFVHGHERTGWPWSRHSKLIFHPAQVAEQIRMNPSYDDGMPLRLVQCYGGKVSEEMQLSCAEILSRELGVEVLATSKPARIDIKTGLLEEQIAPGSRDGIIIG